MTSNPARNQLTVNQAWSSQGYPLTLPARVAEDLLLALMHMQIELIPHWQSELATRRPANSRFLGSLVVILATYMTGKSRQLNSIS